MSSPSREITTQATIWTSVGAVATLGFAGYATVETDNEVGTAAFVLVGLYFAIVAITGRAPRVHGDSEIDPRAAAESAANQTAGALGDVARVAAKLTDTPDGVAGAIEGAAQGIIDRSTTAAVGPTRYERPLSYVYDSLPPNMKQQIINRLNLLPEHRDPTGEPFSHFSRREQEQIVGALEQLLLSGEVHLRN